jgi:transposase-like protein
VLSVIRVQNENGGGNALRRFMLQAAHQKVAAVADKFDTIKLSKTVHMVREGVAKTLAYFTFPSGHHCHIYINNPLENIVRQIRCGTRVVGGIF